MYSINWGSTMISSLFYSIHLCLVLKMKAIMQWLHTFLIIFVQLSICAFNILQMLIVKWWICLGLNATFEWSHTCLTKHFFTYSIRMFVDLGLCVLMCVLYTLITLYINVKKRVFFLYAGQKSWYICKWLQWEIRHDLAQNIFM